MSTDINIKPDKAGTPQKLLSDDSINQSVFQTCDRTQVFFLHLQIELKWLKVEFCLFQNCVSSYRRKTWPGSLSSWFLLFSRRFCSSPLLVKIFFHEYLFIVKSFFATFFVFLYNLLTFFVAIWVMMLEMFEIENLKELYLSFKRAERDWSNCFSWSPPEIDHLYIKWPTKDKSQNSGNPPHIYIYDQLDHQKTKALPMLTSLRWTELFPLCSMCSNTSWQSL